MSGADQLPGRVRHGYGVAAFAIAIANTSVMFFLLKYLVDGAGLPPATTGWVLLVGKVWDGIIDPFVGKLVDGTRTSMGSRRPWLAGASAPFALLFAGLWWGLPLEGAALAVAYAVLLMAYNTAYTLITVPYGALTPALTSDYDERTRLNGSRMAWSMVGGIVASVLFPILWKGWGWHVAGAVLALMLVPPLAVTVWTTAGRDPVGPSEAEDERGMWSVLRNRAFRRTAILFLCAWSSIAVLASLVPFYVEHHLHHKDMIDVLLAAIQLSALASIPGIVWVSNRFEKHRAYAVFVVSWAFVLLGLALVPPGTGGALPIVLGVLAGPGVAAAHVLPWSMLPDVVEADEAETGRERAGAFYGVMTFLEQVGTAFALWGVSMMLSVSGYVEQAAEQPETAREMIRWLIGPIPGVVLVAAAVGAWVLPPMTRAAHKALVAGLRERKQKLAS
jgi:GPH family glycoside/pentoside/hexuronide:cation symporter